MKSIISKVFDNRLITSNNFISIKLVDNSVVCTLQNTFYTKYAEDNESAKTLFETASSEFESFKLYPIDTDYLINLDAITGASISEPTLANQKYTVYILLGKSKVSFCKDTEEDALAFVSAVSSAINSSSSTIVESVTGDMVDNTDNSNPIILHDDTKVDEAILQSNGRILVDINFQTQAGSLIAIKKTYYNIEDNRQEVETTLISSNTLMSTFVEGEESNILTINTKEVSLPIEPPVEPMQPLDVFAAPLDDTANKVDLSDYSYNIEQFELAGQYKLVLHAKNLPIHSNADGVEGAWCGIAIVLSNNDSSYSMTIGQNNYSNLELTEIDGKDCLPIYFDARNSSTRQIKLYKNDELLYNISLEFDVSIKEN